MGACSSCCWNNCGYCPLGPCACECCSLCCVGNHTEYQAFQGPNATGSTSCWPCAPKALYMTEPGSDRAVEEDARTLYRAMKGAGTNESDLIRVVLNRTPLEMRAISKKFEEIAGSPLVNWIKGDTSMDLKRLILVASGDRAALDAKILATALSPKSTLGLGTNDTKLVEILAPRSDTELQKMKIAYDRIKDGEVIIGDIQEDEGKGDVSMVAAIKDDTSNHYKQALMSFMDKREYLAKRIRGAIQTIQGTDDMRLMRILISINRHSPRLRKIVAKYPDVYRRGLPHELNLELSLPTMPEIKQTYQALYGTEMAADISNDTSFNYRETLLKLIMPPGELLADDIKYAIDGYAGIGGTWDDMLIEIVTCHSNSELMEANAFYIQKYGCSLAEAIKADTSWDYENFLVALVTPRTEQLAKAMNNAFKGIGTEDSRMLAVLMSDSKMEISEVAAKYKEMFGKEMIDDIQSETSFWYKSALVYLIRQAQDDLVWIHKRNVMKVQDMNMPATMT